MRCQRPWCLLLLSLLLPTLLPAQQFCAYRMRTHATDCTLLTDGGECDLCYEVDQSRLFSCVPTVAGEVCSGAEWKEIKFVVTDADVPNGITITLAATATALATDPTACGGGQFVTDIAANGTLTCAMPPGGTDANAVHVNVAGEIAGVADKAAPVPGDHLLIEDSAATNAKKDITIGSIPLNILSGAVTDAQVPDGITVTLAATATALATNPTPCPAGQYVSDLAANGTLTCSMPTGGAGDVTGPASATDNAITRFDTTTGKLLQNSSATVDDTGKITAPGGFESGADATTGGYLELCEEADLDPTDCVRFTVGLTNLPDATTTHTLRSDAKLPGTASAGAFTVTNSKAAGYQLGTDDLMELYGGVLYVTAAATITLPVVAAGMSFTVITIGAVAVSVDPNSADTIWLDGTTTGTAGDKVTNTSTTGDMLVCTYRAANTWYCASGSNDGDPWTDTGP